MQGRITPSLSQAADWLSQPGRQAGK